MFLFNCLIRLLEILRMMEAKIRTLTPLQTSKLADWVHKHSGLHSAQVEWQNNEGGRSAPWLYYTVEAVTNRYVLAYVPTESHTHQEIYTCLLYTSDAADE